MSSTVQRYLLKAHATKSHSKYYPWTVVTLLILIGDDDRQRAIATANKLIAKNQWIPISSIHKSTLIEKSVLEQSKEDIETYNAVKNGKIIFTEFADGWCGFKDSPPLLFPKITEKFIDQVILHAGGERYNYDHSSNKPNADYLIDDYIFELKIIEEERLINEAVQDKLADLLYNSNQEIEISESGLDELTYSHYTNIFRSPIQNAVKYASNQIRHTADQFPDRNTKGGLLIINNGTSSFTPKVFNDCVAKCIANNASNIQSYLTINSWSETKNIDTNFQFTINPQPFTTEVQIKISNSYVEIMNSFLTDWARGGFNQDIFLEPLKTISFEKYGIVFTKYGQSME